MSVRISGGAWRGRRLAAPRPARPTQERVREALFSSWAPRVEGACFLDLFAGSGCVGFEALSRGAASCCFVESLDTCARVIEANARSLGVEPLLLARLELPTGMSRFPAGWPHRFDLIFADAPYDFVDDEPLLAALAPRLCAGGEIAVEHSSRRSLAAAGLRVDRVRRYGESALTFLRSVEAPGREHEPIADRIGEPMSPRARGEIREHEAVPSRQSSVRAARKKVSSSR